MTCREATSAIGGFVDGDLSVTEEGAFVSHLAACQPCRNYLAGYRATIAAVKSAHSDDEPSPARVREVVERILASVSAKRRARH